VAWLPDVVKGHTEEGRGAESALQELVQKVCHSREDASAGV